MEQKTSQNAEMHSVSPEVIGVAQMTCPVRQLRFCQSIYKKIFKHFRSEKVLDAIVRVCRYLGYYGPEVLLLDHFLDLFRSSPASRKQVAFVINEISLGTIGIPDGDDLVFKGKRTLTPIHTVD